MKLARISKFSFSTLLIGEHNGKSLNKSFLKIFSAVSQLKEPVDLLLAGPNLSEVCSSINSQIPSNLLQKIILIEQQNLTSLQSDSYSKIIQDLITKNKYNYVVSDTSSLGRDILPRVAATFDSQPVTDITKVIDGSTF